jgi:drug/metabolite transporter (DMT)-like permease
MGKAMFKSIRSADAARLAAAMFVIAVAGAVGHKAGQGMDLQQWLGAAVAVIGSILVAVLVHSEPQPSAAKAKARRWD